MIDPSYLESIREYISWSDVVSYYLNKEKPSMANNARSAKYMQQLQGVIAAVFAPIRQALLDGSAPHEVRCAWGLFCQWFNQAPDQRYAHNWRLRYLFLHGHVYEGVQVLADFRAAIIRYLEAARVFCPEKKVYLSVFEVMNKQAELKKFSEFLYVVLWDTYSKEFPYHRTFNQRVNQCDYKPKNECSALHLIDFLFDKLIHGNDALVNSFFESACGFRALAQQLPHAQPGDYVGFLPAVQTWFFADKADLSHFTAEMTFKCRLHSLDGILEYADPSIPLNASWYNRLLEQCGSLSYRDSGRLLKRFRTPYAMDLCKRALAALPLDIEMPVPKKRSAYSMEEKDRGYWAHYGGNRLVWLFRGYHLIDQHSWQILWRQGVRDFSVFKFKHSSYIGHEDWLDLDLRNLHPAIIKTLPACEEESIPHGLVLHYHRAMTRDYHAKSHLWLAILTAGISLLFFYICHRFRMGLLRRLPETIQPETRYILSAFKFRPVTQVARDYLHHQHGAKAEAVGIRGLQKQQLFGKLPGRHAQIYFDSMQHVPLFQTHRNLDRFLKRYVKGGRQARESYKQQIMPALQQIKPWMEKGIDSEDRSGLPEERERSVPHKDVGLDASESGRRDALLTDLLSRLLKKSLTQVQPDRELCHRLVEPENHYFCYLLLQYYAPVITFIRQGEGLVSYFKDKKRRCRFRKSNSVWYAGFNPDVFLHPQTRINSFIFFSELLHIIRHMRQEERRTKQPHPALSQLGRWRFRKTLAERAHKHARST